MNDAIVHGVRMAGIFRKELCLFHPLHNKGKTEKLAIQKNLGLIIQRLKRDLPDIPVSTLTLKGDLVKNIGRIAEQYDGIMLVLTSEKLKTKLPALQQSQIPFLFVKGSESKYLAYKKAMLPVDLRKVMKDTSLWASYFGRFNKAEVTVLGATEKDRENAQKIKKNLKFIERLLYKLHLDVHFKSTPKGSFGLPFEALAQCRNDGHDLLIVPSSKNISLIDLVVGLPETKIIKKAGEMPVLCINPKRDMYILCD
jgi:hypothetical protein